MLKTKIGLFLADFFQSQPTCHRDINIESFLTDPSFFLNRHMMHVAHIIQTVKHLDEQNPDILCQCHQHALVSRFQFRTHMGCICVVFDLCHPLNNLRVPCSVFLINMLQGHRGVFNGIM